MDYTIAMILAMFISFALTISYLVSVMTKKDKEFAKERADYINRIMAKDTRDYIKLSNADKEVPKTLSDIEILGDDRYGGILN